MSFQVSHDAQVDFSLGMGGGRAHRDNRPTVSGPASGILLLPKASVFQATSISSRSSTPLLRAPLSTRDDTTRLEAGEEFARVVRDNVIDAELLNQIKKPHLRAQEHTKKPVEEAFSTTTPTSNLPKVDLPSFTGDPTLSQGNWSIEHSGIGVHFRHVGRIVGSLHFGHLRFDSRPKELVHNFT